MYRYPGTIGTASVAGLQKALNDVFIDVSDTVTVADVSTLLVISDYTIEVFDDVSTTESVSREAQSFISIFDTIASEDSIAMSVLSQMSVNEQINISENTSSILRSSVTVFDTLTVTDVQSLLPYSFIDIYDDVEITEDLFYYDDMLILEEYININVSEPEIEVNDSVSISEEITGHIEIHIETFDVSVVFDVPIFDGAIPITIYDQCVVTESLSTVASDPTLSLSDTITVQDDNSVTLLSGINTFDFLTLEDVISDFTIVSLVNLHDELTIAEYVEQYAQIQINIHDECDATESADITQTCFIYVDDTTSITDTLETASVATISLAETVTISEQHGLSFVLSTGTIYDALSIEEYIVLNIGFDISVSDELVLSEESTATISSSVYVSDNVTLTENSSVNKICTVNSSDSITILEDIGIYNVIVIASVDSINVIDLFTSNVNSFIDIIDSQSVDEYHGITQVHILSVYDILTPNDVLLGIESLRLSPELPKHRPRGDVLIGESTGRSKVIRKDGGIISGYTEKQTGRL